MDKSDLIIKKLIIVVVLISIILASLIAFIIFDKVVVNDNSNSTNTSEQNNQKLEKDQVRELTENEKTQILKQITEINEYFSPSYPINDINNISNQDKLMFAYMKLSATEYKTSVSSDDIEKMHYQYFGKNNKITHEDINCFLDDGVLYQYNKETKSYSRNENHPGHGGHGAYNNKVYLVDGTVKNEKEYSVTVNIVYENHCADICGPATAYYKSAKDSYNRSNSIYTNQDPGNYEFQESDYESIKDKLDKTTFILHKDDNGNIGITQVKIN